MARTLEELQKQYNKASGDHSLRGGPGGGRGPGGPGPRGARMGGKPKNLKTTVSRLLTYVGRYKYRLILVFFCMIFSTVFSLCGGYLIAPIINRITLEINPGANLQYSPIERFANGIIESFTETGLIQKLMQGVGAITVYIACALIILALIYAVSILSSYLQARIMVGVSQSSVQSIRNDLFEKLQKLPVRYFDSNPTGEIMSRFTNDVDNIDVMLNNSLTSIVSGMISLIGTFVFMLTTSIWLTLITIVFIPVFIFGGRIIGKRSSKFYGAQQSALGAVNGYIEETISGQKVIKVFNHEDECVEEFNLINEDLRNKQMNAQFWGGIMGPIMGNTGQISYALTVGIGGVLMCTSGFTPGALTVFAGYSRHFSMPINQISMQVSTIFAALAGAERVFKVMDADPAPPKSLKTTPQSFQE